MSEHVERVAELTDRIETARADRLEAMGAARASGATWRAIAAAAAAPFEYWDAVQALEGMAYTLATRGHNGAPVIIAQVRRVSL